MAAGTGATEAQGTANNSIAAVNDANTELALGQEGGAGAGAAGGGAVAGGAVIGGVAVAGAALAVAAQASASDVKHNHAHSSH